MERLQRLAISDQGFVFDPATGESFSLNSTGLFILKGLKQGADQREVALNLAEVFDVDPQEAERDVSDFYYKMRALKLF